VTKPTSIPVPKFGPAGPSAPVPPGVWSTVAVFYVIIFGALAVLLVAAGVTAMSRQRRRFRDAGISDSTPDEEEEEL
jgi:hypothetical protein